MTSSTKWWPPPVSSPLDSNNRYVWSLGRTTPHEKQCEKWNWRCTGFCGSPTASTRVAFFFLIYFISNWQLLTGELFVPKHICLSEGALNTAAWLINSLAHFVIWIAIPQVAARDKIVLMRVNFLSPYVFFFFLYLFPLFILWLGSCSTHSLEHLQWCSPPTLKTESLKYMNHSGARPAYVNVPLNLCLQVAH